MLGVSFADVVHTPEFMEIRAKNYLYSGEYDKVRMLLAFHLR